MSTFRKLLAVLAVGVAAVALAQYQPTTQPFYWGASSIPFGDGGNYAIRLDAGGTFDSQGLQALGLIGNGVMCTACAASSADLAASVDLQYSNDNVNYGYVVGSQASIAPIVADAGVNDAGCVSFGWGAINLTRWVRVEETSTSTEGVLSCSATIKGN